MNIFNSYLDHLVLITNCFLFDDCLLCLLDYPLAGSRSCLPLASQWKWQTNLLWITRPLVGNHNHLLLACVLPHSTEGGKMQVSKAKVPAVERVVVRAAARAAARVASSRGGAGLSGIMLLIFSHGDKDFT
jgi:hypothetical protein